MPRRKHEGLFLKNPPFLCRDEGMLRGTTLLGARKNAPGFCRSVTGTPRRGLAAGPRAGLPALRAFSLGALSAFGGMVPCIACNSSNYIPYAGKFQLPREIYFFLENEQGRKASRLSPSALFNGSDCSSRCCSGWRSCRNLRRRSWSAPENSHHRTGSWAGTGAN